MLCFTCVLDFSRVFTCVFDTMLGSKSRVETREKHKKFTQREKNARNVFYMVYYYRNKSLPLNDFMMIYSQGFPNCQTNQLYNALRNTLGYYRIWACLVSLEKFRQALHYKQDFHQTPYGASFPFLWSHKCTK